MQLRSTQTHPFNLIDSYVPLGSTETRLYRMIREAVPVVDAAILKIVRLTGGFEARCADKKRKESSASLYAPCRPAEVREVLSAFCRRISIQ